MTADGTTAKIDCPACGTPLTIPVTLSMTDRATAAITFNTLTVQDHLKEHALTGGGEELGSEGD